MLLRWQPCERGGRNPSSLRGKTIRKKGREIKAFDYKGSELRPSTHSPIPPPSPALLQFSLLDSRPSSCSGPRQLRTRTNDDFCSNNNNVVEYNSWEKSFLLSYSRKNEDYLSPSLSLSLCFESRKRFLFPLSTPAKVCRFESCQTPSCASRQARTLLRHTQSHSLSRSLSLSLARTHTRNISSHSWPFSRAMCLTSFTTTSYRSSSSRSKSAEQQQQRAAVG